MDSGSYQRDYPLFVDILKKSGRFETMIEQVTRNDISEEERIEMLRKIRDDSIDLLNFSLDMAMTAEEIAKKDYDINL